MNRSLVGFAGKFLVFFIFCTSARANFTGNDTSNFNPTANGIDFVTVQSTETLGYGFVNFSLFFNRAKNTLPDTIMANGNYTKSDDTVIFGDIGVAYGLLPRLELGLSVSYLLNQQTEWNNPGAQFAGTGLNEIKWTGKYTLIKRNPVGMAIIPSINFNQARNNPFSGYPSRPTFNLELATDYKIGDFLFAFNIGHRWRNKGAAVNFSVFKPLPDQTIASTALSYYLESIDTKLIGEIYAAKADESVDYVDSTKISSEFIVGAKHDVSTYYSLNAGGGTRIGEGLFTPDWRIYAGLTVDLDLFHKKQSEPVVEEKTEPKVEAANPQIVKNYVMGYRPEDIEKLKNVDFDEIRKDFDFPIRKTVTEADISSLKKPPFEVIRLNNVEFDFGSSVIKPEYKPLLDRVARYLSAGPDVLKFRVEGHTDSIGSEARNADRSKSRSQAIRDYILKAGHLKPETIVENAGFGSGRPIADNGNFQGRAQNRRVEIRILRRLNEIPETEK